MGAPPGLADDEVGAPAHDTPPGDSRAVRRAPTQRDVADEAGLSTAAVSYALRGIRVPQETQDRVREIAERIGYRANPIARALASGRTDVVGIVCGSLIDSWQQRIVAELVSVLPSRGLSAHILDAASDPALQLELAGDLVSRQADALVVMPLDPAAEEWARIARSVPVVAVGDALVAAEGVCEIVYDNATGVSDGLRRLVDAGHTCIGVLTPGHPSTPDRPAEDVVNEVATSLGVIVTLHAARHDLESTSTVVQQVLRGPDPPTAFFCLSDSMAWGVYGAAAQLDLTIPADLSVVGYDNTPVSRLLSPPLTTYNWPIAELIDAIVAGVEAAVAGVEAAVAGLPRARTVITPTPVLRTSIAPPRR